MSVKKFRPSNGVSYGCNYTVTAEDLVDQEINFDFSEDLYFLAPIVSVKSAAGVHKNLVGLEISTPSKGVVKIKDSVADFYEKKVLTIGGTSVSGAGSVDVVLAGASAVNVPIADTDSKVAVATKIAAASFPGWVTSRSGAIVTFTATTVGNKANTDTFTLNTSTGVTGTFTYAQEGSSNTGFGFAVGDIVSIIAQRATALLA